MLLDIYHINITVNNTDNVNIDKNDSDINYKNDNNYNK